MTIRTPRLELTSANADLVRMEFGDHAQLGQALNAAVPRDWPPEAVRDALEFFARTLEETPTLQGWLGYYWIADAGVESPESRVLIGHGGFLGRPDAEGRVEIGYSVLPEFQNKGYATEAVQALVAWAMSQPGVAQVIAEVSSDNAASVRVLTKCGFAPVGAGSAPELSRFEYNGPSV